MKLMFRHALGNSRHHGGDVGTSVLLSKSGGQFVKNEDAKRLITSGAKKVIESI